MWWNLKIEEKIHKSPCSMSFLVGGMTILPKEKSIDTLLNISQGVLITLI